MLHSLQAPCPKFALPWMSLPPSVLTCVCKGNSVPVQAWAGTEGSRSLRLQDLRQSAHESDKVVSPTHRPHLTPRKYSRYSFLLWAGSSVGTATDYGLDGPGIESPWGEIFRPSRPALGPNQPPVQWVPGLSRG